MWRNPLLLLLTISIVFTAACGGGSSINIGQVPTVAPDLDGEVARRGSSAVSQVDDGDLYVRIVVTNPNPSGTDIETIRYCLKYDPEENDPLTADEAKGYLDPIPATLPDNIDVQTVGYTGSPQIIEIRDFKGGSLTPNDRYWLSAVFVSSTGEAGPATTPQRFKLIFMYHLVEPPVIGIVKDFQGCVKDHLGGRLPNAFVQYWHEGSFLEAAVTDDNGCYYFEVIVPNPTGTSALKQVCCEESDDPTDYEMHVYYPLYDQEIVKYLLPEYVHYYVDFKFPSEWYNHEQGGGTS